MSANRANPSSGGLAAGYLKPYSWATENEIRREDVPVFKAAAGYFNHYILVRATNPKSLQYMQQSGFCSKPMDCKPKTATIDAMVAGRRVQCGGLVVDPSILPGAFSGEKYNKAMSTWAGFISGRSQKEIDNKVFRRAGGAGFYAVDTFPESPRYGCLMISGFSIPEGNFSLSDSGSQRFRRTLNLNYVFGDYDLYGLIDVDYVLNQMGQGGLAEKRFEERPLLGGTNSYSPSFEAIRKFLNDGIGVEMIMHGAQDTLYHDDDKIYVFTPMENAYVLDANEAAIREVYRHVLKEQPMENRI